MNSPVAPPEGARFWYPENAITPTDQVVKGRLYWRLPLQARAAPRRREVRNRPVARPVVRGRRTARSRSSGKTGEEGPPGPAATRAGSGIASGSGGAL